MLNMYISERYAELNPTWGEEDSPWKAAHIERIIRDNNLNFSELCEIGCGAGEILLSLSRAFPDAAYRGYDIAPAAIKRASRKESEHLKFYLADPLQEPDFKTDIIVLADVFEHVEDYIAFLKAVQPRSRYKIFHIPLDLSVQSLLRGWPIMNLRKQVGHLHYYFKDTAIATLTDCGYKIIDYKYTASRLELPNQAFSSRVMRLPRKMLFSIAPDLTVRILGGYSLLVLAE